MLSWTCPGTVSPQIHSCAFAQYQGLGGSFLDASMSHGFYPQEALGETGGQEEQKITAPLPHPLPTTTCPFMWHL